jgi:hypothetical protein
MKMALGAGKLAMIQAVLPPYMLSGQQHNAIIIK